VKKYLFPLVRSQASLSISWLIGLHLSQLFETVLFKGGSAVVNCVILSDTLVECADDVFGILLSIAEQRFGNFLHI